ncbi:MAG: M15 family metallopeptidase [Ilumatobacteraceae bacterium]
MRTVVAAVVAAVALTLAPGASALPDDGSAVEFPDRALVPTMTISRSVSLTTAQTRQITAGARSGGAVGHAVRYATIGLTSHQRGSRKLLSLRGTWRLPMYTKIASVDFFRTVGGDALADVLARGEVVMGETSASVRKARVGDKFTLRSRSFKARKFTVGAIVADEFVDSGDLAVATPVMSSRLGLPKISRVVITGIDTPARVLKGLRSRGVVPGSAWRLRTSWDAPNPDGTLGLATVKKLFGEVAYRPNGGSAVLVDQQWAMRNISWKRLYSSIPLYNNCHTVVADALQKALNEIAARGLSGEIDVKNSNRYGGCLTTRYNRLAGVFPGLSRHAFGMAIDVNPSTNQQGATPTIDCRVVRIMRKWGFAWGGNFWPADGMHFEWVGEPRHQWGYKSRFCPNSAAVPKVSFPSPSSTTTTTTTTTVESTTTSSSLPPVDITSPPAETTTSVTSVP